VPQIAGYFTRVGARDIPVLASGGITPGPLVSNQAIYNIGGVHYDCRALQGLVKVVAAPSGTTNRVIFSDDPYALFSGLCWLFTHGDEDEPASGEALNSWISRMGSTAKVQKLRLRCGHAVNFAKHMMTYYGFPSRTVRWLTMEDPAGQPWQGIDEGHITMESYISGAWRNLDPDTGRYLTDAAGVHVEVRALPALVASDIYIAEGVAADSLHAVEAYEAGEFDLTGYQEIAFLRDDGLGDGTRRWTQRIHQAVGWDHVGLNEVWWLLPAGSEGRASWVLGLQSNYRIKTAAEIAATFYP
jgi:hypothetical protein